MGADEKEVHSSCYDQELYLLATQRAVFSGAIAVISSGKPLSESQLATFRAAMDGEGVSAGLREPLLEKAASGFSTLQVELNPLFDLEQIIQYLTALSLLSYRHFDNVVKDRPPVLRGIARMYGLSSRAELLISQKLESLVGPPHGALSEHLEEFLNPPPFLDSIVEAVIQIIDPSRKPKRNISKISPSRYQHPVDKDRLNAVHNAVGIEDLVSEYYRHVQEKADRVLNLSDKVRVGPSQFPALYNLFKGCVERVGVRPEPELYLTNGMIGASTSGVDRPYLVLESGAVSLCSKNELEFILGHELGHVVHQHVLYHAVGSFCPAAANWIPGFGNLVSGGLAIALFDWFRASELSADRVGLLVCQDLEAAINVMMKWSGVPPVYYRQINIAAFLDQAKDFDRLDSDIVSSFVKMSGVMFKSHPWTVTRAAELKRWHDAGEYKALLGESPQAIRHHSPAGPLLTRQMLPSQCPVCSALIGPGDRFCSSCGAPSRAADKFSQCPACGKACSPIVKFCEHCGQQMQKDEKGV